MLESPRLIGGVELFGDAEVVPRTRGNKITNGAVVHEVAGDQDLGPVLSVFGEHEHAVVVLRSCSQDAFAGVDCWGHWLFERHVHTCLERLGDQGFVEMMRHQDCQRIDTDVDCFCDRRTRLAAGERGQFVGALGGHVDAGCDHSAVRMFQRCGMPFGDCSAAHESESKVFHGAEISATRWKTP